MLAALFGTIPDGRADTYFVTTTNITGEGSISDAFIQANLNPPAIINFARGLGTISLPFSGGMDGEILIEGNGNTVTADHGISPVFTIAAGAPGTTIRTQNFTIQAFHGSPGRNNGSAGGATDGGSGGTAMTMESFAGKFNLTGSQILGGNGGRGGDGYGASSIGNGGRGGTAIAVSANGNTITNASGLIRGGGGGNGGDGDADGSSGSNGAQGGGAIVLSGNQNSVANKSGGIIQGGSGGEGGRSPTLHGSPAGGGTAIAFVGNSGVITNDDGGSILGGDGGKGGGTGSDYVPPAPGASAITYEGESGTVNNSGTIRAGTGALGGAAITISGGNGTILNSNTGAIENPNGGPAILFAAASGTVTNRGTIAGIKFTSGAAAVTNSGTIDNISFTGSDNVLTLEAGYWMNANVVVSNRGTNNHVYLGGDADGTFSNGGQYQGFDTFVKTGASTWTLTETSISASWEVRAGILKFSDEGSLGSGAVALTGGELLSSETLTVTRNIQSAGLGRLAAVTGTTATYSGTVNTASLQIGDSGNGGTIELTNPDSSVGDLTVSGGALTVSQGGRVSGTSGRIGSGSGAGAATVTDAGSSWINTGKLAIGDGGTGTLTITTGGTVRSDDAVYVGANGGTGTLNIGAAAGDSAAIPGSLVAGSVILGSGKIVFNHSASAYSFASAISGSGSVDVVAGTTTLRGVNTYSGGTFIRGGTLEIGGDSALGSGTITLTGGGIRAADAPHTLSNALVFNGNFALGRSTNFSGNVILAGDSVITSTNPDARAATDSTLSGVISGDHALGFEAGSNPIGRIVLTGTNTYTGATTINGGTVIVDGSIAASSRTTVNGGTLGGHGTVGAVTIASGGTISPGNSPGSMNTLAETWNGGGKYEWELNDATGTKGATSGPGWDWLNISGDLTIASTTESKFTIVLTSLGLDNLAGPAAHLGGDTSWIIASASGGITGFDPTRFFIDASHFANQTNAGHFGLSVSGNDLVLSYSVIPEPSTCAVGVAGLLGGLILLRRRRALA